MLEAQKKHDLLRKREKVWVDQRGVWEQDDWRVDLWYSARTIDISEGESGTSKLMIRECVRNGDMMNRLPSQSADCAQWLISVTGYYYLCPPGLSLFCQLIPTLNSVESCWMDCLLKKIIKGTEALLLAVRQVWKHDTDEREGERQGEQRSDHAKDVTFIGLLAWWRCAERCVATCGWRCADTDGPTWIDRRLDSWSHSACFSLSCFLSHFSFVFSFLLHSLVPRC